MIEISSWGRLSRERHEAVDLADRTALAETLARGGTGIPFGLGRSYGDVCLNPGGRLWRTAGLDRYIAFDPETGVLDCEAGVVLRDIQLRAARSGWRLPVLPGTQFVTVGGAIANDVHGKNHHVHGTFGDAVESLHLVRTDGATVECGPGLDEDLFRATVGGLGLTGLIASARIRLARGAAGWLDAETLPFEGVAPFLLLADGSEADWEHTVAWIDCTSAVLRGLFMRARPAASGERPVPHRREFAVPVTPPVSLVNRLTLRPFNELYFRLGRRHADRRRVPHDSFLFPLDTVRDWNRLYGPAGFYQYQCIVPRPVAADALGDMLSAIRGAGAGSTLAVLKTFADRPSCGLLSFAQPGVTLALDFPNRGTSTLGLFDRLDAILSAAGGRLYPAKDARMPRALFERGYGAALDAFARHRDPGMSSALSRRLLGS
ncbi:MAG: FAD-binding oxidoreductase [Enhydrobacter sp.]|nr:MAG: FAD-binding oxidoreductase [Enhydrobacter sp.]